MSLLQKIYNKSPILIQNILVSLSGYQRNFSRYGKAYKEHLIFLADFDTWSLEKKLEYQEKTLSNFIQYASNNSEFYQKIFKEIDVNRIKKTEDLKKIPVLEKEILRQKINEISTVSRMNAIEGHTGGTTGKSLVVLYTREDMMKRMAMLDHFKSRVGFTHRKMKRATFNGKHIISPKQKRKIFWRYNISCKQMIFSSFHLTEENMEYYVEALNKFKPDALDGFFMSLCDIASYIERHGKEISFQPVAIFPTSETLTKSGRELLERVFKCKVYDQYASSEGAPFITECKHKSLHVELSSGVFEKFENGSDEVLVTSFTTHGTPLIRYKIGDSLRMKNDSKCSCGLESPLVEEIYGRKLDFLYTAEGAKINGGNVANLFKNMPNALIRAQTIQNTLNEITIKLEVDKKRYRIEYDNLLKEEFRHKFGENTRIIIEHVD